MGRERDGDEDGTGREGDGTENERYRGLRRVGTVWGRGRDRDTKRMGIGTGSWTDMHMMDCWIIVFQGFIEPNSVKLSLCHSVECLC